MGLFDGIGKGGRIGLGIATGGSSELWNLGTGNALYGNDGGGGGFDINSELAKITALFEQMRKQGTININREAGQGRMRSVNNMAARGTLRAPVAEHTFNALEDTRLNNLANFEAELGGKEASLRGGILGQLMSLSEARRLREQQAKAARFGQLASLGGSLAIAGLTGNPAPLAQTALQGYQGGWGGNGSSFGGYA